LNLLEELLSIEKNRFDYSTEIVTDEGVWNLKPDFSCPLTLLMRGVIVTRASRGRNGARGAFNKNKKLVAEM
jgi:hypothetical protein